MNKLTSRFVVIFISAMLLAGALWYVGPTQVLLDFGRFPAWSIATVLGIFTVNIFVVSLRLSRILAHFGVWVPPGGALRANISGHLAGLFIISIFGQVIGRHLALRQFGISSVLVATLTAYERIILVLVGGGLCLTGAILLIDRSTIVSFLTEIAILEIALTCVGGLVLSLWIGRSRFELQLARTIRSLQNVLNFLEIGGITLLAQTLVLGAFVVGILALNPQADPVSVIAAAAVISFAASIPVTVNGWGVRELTAVYILGHLGISNSNALAVSISVGICSTAVILMAAPLALKKYTALTAVEPQKSVADVASLDVVSKINFEKSAVWLISMTSAILIFFQTHIALPGGTANLNLADPFAIIALATVLTQILATRQAPRWGVAGFNWALALVSFVLVFAFFRGVQEIGITQWAVASRLMGWLVLLGYLSIGYLLVSVAGTNGLRRFTETMISTAAVVVIVQVLTRLLNYLGLDMFHITANFEGFSGNRNAFAYQLLVCSALILAYSTVQFRVDRFVTRKATSSEGRAGFGIWGKILGMFGARRVLFSMLHGIILAGIIFTGSLGGLIAGAALFTLSWFLRIGDRRLIIMSVLFGVLIWKLPHFASWVQAQLGVDGVGALEVMINTHLSGDDSHYVRWQTIIRGLQLWQEAPVFGAGLGVFIFQSVQWIDKPTVIHSTPVWVLSELGLFGLAIFLWAFYVLVRFLRRGKVLLPKHRIILTLLAVFLIFGLVHEIFFQRIFWLVLGAAAGLSAYSPTVRARAAKVVFHIITGLNAGGAERMLTRLVGSPRRDEIMHSVVSLMDEGVFGQDIKAKGIQLYTLGMLPGVPSPFALFRLVRLLRREKPDVLMSWLYHADLMAFVAGSIAGIKQKYWNLRCSDMTQSNRSISSRMMMGLLVRLSPYTKGVVVNSEAGRRHHQALGYRPKKWHVISNGVSLDEFKSNPASGQKLRAELGIPNDALLIGHVARFHPMKDHVTMLETAKMVVQANPRAHFVLMGKDVCLDTPFFMERLGIGGAKGRVHLLGGHRNIAEILSGLDLFVLTSAYGEGAPNVIIEAMASSVSCVVTDVGDAAMIVSDTGRVVPIKDAGALSTAIMEQLALSEAERKTLGLRARARIEDHYAIEGVLGRYRTLFLEQASE